MMPKQTAEGLISCEVSNWNSIFKNQKELILSDTCLVLNSLIAVSYAGFNTVGGRSWKLIWKTNGNDEVIAILPKPVDNISVSGDMKELFATCCGVGHVYDIKTGNKIRTRKAPCDIIASCYTPHGSALALVSRDVIFPPEAKLKPILLQSNAIALAWCETSGLLAVLESDKATLFKPDTSSHCGQYIFKNNDTAIRATSDSESETELPIPGSCCIAWHHSSSILLITLIDCAVTLEVEMFSSSNPSKQLQMHPVAIKKPRRSIQKGVFSDRCSDHHVFLSTTYPGGVLCWNYHSNCILWCLDLFHGRSPSLCSFVDSSDKNIISIAGGDGLVKLAVDSLAKGFKSSKPEGNPLPKMTKKEREKSKEKLRQRKGLKPVAKAAKPKPADKKKNLEDLFSSSENEGNSKKRRNKNIKRRKATTPPRQPTVRENEIQIGSDDEPPPQQSPAPQKSSAGRISLEAQDDSIKVTVLDQSRSEIIYSSIVDNCFSAGKLHTISYTKEDRLILSGRKRTECISLASLKIVWSAKFNPTNTECPKRIHGTSTGCILEYNSGRSFATFRGNNYSWTEVTDPSALLKVAAMEGSAELVVKAAVLKKLPPPDLSFIRELMYAQASSSGG